MILHTIIHGHKKRSKPRASGDDPDPLMSIYDALE